MRLQRLHVRHFAGVPEATIDFGPGLNVLYGPNDLGKSSLVDAIRLALLLPHGSSHAETFAPWKGTGTPFVELCFQTDEQRFWRVRKSFGKSGSSSLDESKNGRDFDECERGRKVDGRVRELLGWGLQEPGGVGGQRGLPESFLSTVLLAAQEDVGAVLQQTLAGDDVKSGRDQIAAALQAVAHDPLFIQILNTVQAKRDEAYTDKGKKSLAKGSAFKVAADRVKAKREEVESLRHIVSESEGAEHLIRQLTTDRDRRQQLLSEAINAAETLVRLDTQAREHSVAADAMRVAQEEVRRIERLDEDVADGERRLGTLGDQVIALKTQLVTARTAHAEATLALKAAAEIVAQEEGAPGVTDTVARQGIELRSRAAEQGVVDAEQRIAAIGVAQSTVDTLAKKTQDCDAQQALEASARHAAANAEKALTALEAEAASHERLDGYLQLVEAERQLAAAEAASSQKNTVELQQKAASEELARLVQRRSRLTVPPPDVLAVLRTLDGEVAAARAALALGLVVSVTPRRPLDLEIRKDGGALEMASIDAPLEVEVGTKAEISIAGVVTFEVAAGRRSQRELAQAREGRWTTEVLPHLQAAGVSTLDQLVASVDEARLLDSRIREQGAALETLTQQLLPLHDTAEKFVAARDRVTTARASVTDVTQLRTQVATLGADPASGLRTRRARVSAEIAGAQKSVSETSTLLAVASERLRQSQAGLEEGTSQRDAALRAFPEGIANALTTAQSAFATARAGADAATAELKALERSVLERKNRIDAQLKNARMTESQAAAAVDAASAAVSAAEKSHAIEEGRLGALKAQRAAEGLPAAQSTLLERTTMLAALPVPERVVMPEQIAKARAQVEAEQNECARIQRDLHMANGALAQVGGAVAKEKLRDAEDALASAERLDRETEAESEAWRLLLEQMKEAEAAQASNLGQAFVPAITESFRALTRERYEGVQLTADLGTDGVIVSGAVRSHGRLSVGTREQLSTLYRVALADYLNTALVLDDQLVQSDDGRMGWFRQMLNEKARKFQIVVFTCRPDDYLSEGKRVPPSGPLHLDCEDGPVRLFDLGRALLQ